MLEKNPWVSIKLLKTSLTSEVSDHFIEDVCMSNQGEVTLLEVIAKHGFARKASRTVPNLLLSC